MPRRWTNWLFAAILFSACHSTRQADGVALEIQILAEYNLSKDFSDQALLHDVMKEVNCADSTICKKRLVLAEQFHSTDTSEILLIPYISNGKIFKSSAYSNVESRYVLINPGYIREFALKNTLNDTASYKPLLELMLLHEVGHFVLQKTGAFDAVESSTGAVGEQKSESQPEFLTLLKKNRTFCRLIAIDIVKNALKSAQISCLSVGFDVQRIIPGMQFQMSGMRMLEHFGSANVGFLHDPSSDHPNLELRVTFMNYFLLPNPSIRKLIQDYLYERTVAPVHRQEYDPRIYQGNEKKLPIQ